MGCSLVLGMGLPSAVSDLLLATIIGPVFADPALGVPILAACSLAAACALVPDSLGIAGTSFSVVDPAGLGILAAVLSRAARAS